jgi:hypothetical protein
MFEMRALRIACYLSLVLVGLVGAGFRGAATVSATTGGPGPTPARYRVDPRIAGLYPGQYSMQSAASGARLARGQMAIDINELGYLQGVVQFAAYNAQGRQSTWVAVLYNFHVATPNTMTIGLYGPVESVLLGMLYVQRTKQGDLVGQIALPRARYAIRWRKNIS